MTHIEDEYYYKVIINSIGSPYVKVYLKRTNRKWYQRQYKFMHEDLFTGILTNTPHEEAISIVEEIKSRFGGMSQKEWGKSLEDKTMRKV